MKKLIAATAIGGALLVPLMSGCSSSNDDEFIRRLDANHIHYNSKDKAIKGAHQICSYLDQGYSVDSATDLAGRALGYSYSTGYIVGASIGVYCPKYGNQI